MLTGPLARAESPSDGWRARGTRLQTPAADEPVRPGPTAWTTLRPQRQERAAAPAARLNAPTQQAASATFAEAEPSPRAPRSILLTQATRPGARYDDVPLEAPSFQPSEPSVLEAESIPQGDPEPISLQAPPAELTPRPMMKTMADDCRDQVESCEKARRELDGRKLLDIDIGFGFAGTAGTDYPCECPAPTREESLVVWSPVCFHWTASSLCHKPLYFEDVQLERYGHVWGCCLQPVFSAAHFFGTVPTLPYQMGMDPPWECKYALGYYRPGNCAPWNIGAAPFNKRGTLLETGVAVGLVFLIP